MMKLCMLVDHEIVIFDAPLEVSAAFSLTYSSSLSLFAEHSSLQCKLLLVTDIAVQYISTISHPALPISALRIKKKFISVLCTLMYTKLISNEIHQFSQITYTFSWLIAWPMPFILVERKCFCSYLLCSGTEFFCPN